MQQGMVHIVGAGLAGLSAAVHLSAAGCKVVLYEAGTHAGGRCRSYHDKELDCLLDNGNHLLLSCNEAALTYLDLIGAAGSLAGPPDAAFPFMDVLSGQRWNVKINEGHFPSWIFSKRARVPDTKWRDYLDMLKLMKADRWATVAQKLNPQGTLYRRLWQPLTVGILNTQPEEASARLLGDVLKEAFKQGGKGCRPLTAKIGLSESFVDPALHHIEQRGGSIHYGKRLRSFEVNADDEAQKLVFADGEIALSRWDWLVLAVPAPVINDLIPKLPTPTEFRGIVNAHFRVPGAGAKGIAITGLIGGTAEWVFEKDGVLSTTTSAADAIIGKSAEELAALLWRDVALLVGLDATAIPPHRIVKEKRATFAATPDQLIRRPKITPRHANMVICGDWTQTGLPSTIEGAIRSGRAAARCIVAPRL